MSFIVVFVSAILGVWEGLEFWWCGLIDVN